MEKEIIVTTLHNIENIVREVVREQLIEFSKWFESKITTEDKLLTRQEAISYLGVSASTLHRWTKRGKLPSHGCGARVYYKLSDIQASLIAISN